MVRYNKPWKILIDRVWRMSIKSDLSDTDFVIIRMGVENGAYK